jgi:hypothetical protein
LGRSFRLRRADETRREEDSLHIYLFSHSRNFIAYNTIIHSLPVSIIYHYPPCIPYFTDHTCCFPLLSAANERRSNIHCPPSRTFSLVELRLLRVRKHFSVESKIGSASSERASCLWVRVVIIIISIRRRNDQQYQHYLSYLGKRLAYTR